MCSWGKEKGKGLVSWGKRKGEVECLRGGGSDFGEERDSGEKRLRKNQREKGKEVPEGKLKEKKERGGFRLREVNFLRKLG